MATSPGPGLVKIEIPLLTIQFPQVAHRPGGGGSRPERVAVVGEPADMPDPDNFLRHSVPLAILRRVGWQDPELDAWLERAAHTPERAVRMALYCQADRRLVAALARLRRNMIKVWPLPVEEPW